MKFLKKLRNRRGMSLIEVLLVVALMMILLGIAMPDLISESRAIKLAGMNGNARAVAVAVQSKLYGMKNKGTTVGSEFYTLNNAAGKTYVFAGDEAEGTDARYFANFGETARVGKQILSGAITDSELLNGKIVVAYDPTTADIFEVFYAEDVFLPDEPKSPDPSEGTDPSESTDPSDKTEETDLVLPNSNLFPTVSERYLTENMIGSYFGDPKPELTRKDGLPPFTAVWRYDDELYLELQMVQRSSTSIEGLLNRNLGIEVYAEIPAEGNSRKMEEVLIYAEGMFGVGGVQNGGNTIIAADHNGTSDNALTLNNISNNKVTEGGKTKEGILRFAFDSMVTTRAFWGGATSDLRHQSSPAVTTMRSEVLYPRESITNWFNKNVNPYLTYWEKFGDSAKNNSIAERIDRGASATEFIDVNETFRLHIKMYVLDDELNTKQEDPDSPKKEKPETTTKDDFTATVYQPDKSIGVLDIRSPNITPYFYALSTAQNKVTLSSVRDLNNLPYVFETENKINTAVLSSDISAQQLYDKIVKVHKALDDNNTTKGKYSGWGYDSDQDAAQVDTNYFKNKTSFTLSGTKPASLGGGSYKIISVTFGGRSPDLGGLFGYAENCTFKDLDIVNPKVLRNSSSRSVLGNNDTNNMSPNLGYGAVASGALAAIAVNCTFTNVRAYIDPGQTLKATSDGNLPREKWPNATITGYRVSGSVVGGLVGVAVGSSSVKTYYDESEEHTRRTWVTESTTLTSTTFTNCVASTILGPEYYYPPTECFVAGGLIGATVGDVQITSSYASSQLSAYYAGGLVGAVGSVGADDSTDLNVRDWIISANFPDHGIFKAGIATGRLMMKNSFAAGVIQHMVRVGGGLIAYISKNAYSPKGVGVIQLPVDATDCYSAVRWRIVPPVAYGTFKDDTKNYYLYPTGFDLPVTANVVARFSTTNHSNVFSLQKGMCGVACSGAMLTAKLSNTGTEPGAGTALKDEWKNVETTTTWKYLEFDSGTDKSIDGPYPFPMPEGNTEFWGNWIRYYDETATSDQILTGKKASFTFDSYYATYYHNPWSMYPRNVDPGAITMRGIKLEKDTIYIDGLPLGEDGATLTSDTMVPRKDANGDYVTQPKLDESGKQMLDEKGEVIREQVFDPGVIKSYYWAEKAATEEAVLMKDAETAKAEINCGQGVDHGEVYGATKITPHVEGEEGTEDKEEYIDFASATYYKSSYKPLTGSDFHPGIDKDNITRLMWDHYGFYLLLDFNPNDEIGNLKYYITVEEGLEAGTAIKGTDHFNVSWDVKYDEQGEVISRTEVRTNLSYANITVNKTQFETAIGYRTIRVPATNATITWDKDYGLHVNYVEVK